LCPVIVRVSLETDHFVICQLTCISVLELSSTCSPSDQCFPSCLPQPTSFYVGSLKKGRKFKKKLTVTLLSQIPFFVMNAVTVTKHTTIVN